MNHPLWLGRPFPRLLLEPKRTMHHSHSHPTARRNLRYSGSVPSLLESLTGDLPLYVHARNWLAELATIAPLTGLLIDESDQTAIFPEQGLVIALGQVAAVHGVPLLYGAHQTWALEIAAAGEPRAVSIVAIPEFSDMEHFTRSLHRHPADVLCDAEYRQWREAFAVIPPMCPCCHAAAEERRTNPERNPLARIFWHSIESQLALRCQIISPAMGFSCWLTPKTLEFSKRGLTVLAEGGRSLLEVDVGICHSLQMVCRLIDAEPFTEIHLYDSLGELHLQIAACGWHYEAIWRGLCRKS
jgi:hypothetical protein